MESVEVRENFPVTLVAVADGEVGGDEFGEIVDGGVGVELDGSGWEGEAIEVELE